VKLEHDLFLDGETYLARLDGASDLLWEPLWRLRTKLRPVERALLTCSPVRRLHFVRQGGGSSIATQHTHTRLQHTLGVFSLVAHFRPEDDILRAAALLHDVGHAPFCHTLEGLDGVDHHRWTQDRILSPPIADVLTQHDLDPQSVLDCISGETANLLRNDDGILHTDHLDCWVRSAQAAGILPRPAPEILARLRLKGSYLDTDVETAELLVGLIVAEAHFYCTAANLGPNAILKHLVQQLLDARMLTTNDLATMTDSMAERALFENPLTAEEAWRLWYQPHAIVTRRIESEDAPPAAHIVQMDHLYLAVPLADGQIITQVSARADALVAEARELHGTYAVYWDDAVPSANRSCQYD
jgi:HD superfamily phosphohydrolase